MREIFQPCGIETLLLEASSQIGLKLRRCRAAGMGVSSGDCNVTELSLYKRKWGFVYNQVPQRL